MSTMPLLWMFALNFFCFAASTRFDAPALPFLVVVVVFVRRRRDNNKELSERVFYERKKRRLRCSRRRRVLLLNRARLVHRRPVCFLNRASTSHQLSSEGKCRLVCLCPIQTIIQRARENETQKQEREY